MTYEHYLTELKTNGFVVGKNIIPQDMINKITESLKKTFIDQLKNLGLRHENDDLFYLMQSLHKNNIEKYKKTLSALWRKFDVYEFMHSPHIINFVKNVMNWEDLFLPGGQVVHIMAEELKIPDGYFGIHPHQDFPSVQGSLDGLVTWVPLVDVSEKNYSMDVLPKSHLNGILPTNQDNSDTWKTDESAYDASKFYTINANAGDIVLMTNFTLHRSSLLGDNKNYRLAISNRLDNANEPTFIERCYPSAYIRNIQREQFVENFPKVEQVKEIFKN